jgi:hypothetical protein
MNSLKHDILELLPKTFMWLESVPIQIVGKWNIKFRNH